MNTPVTKQEIIDELMNLTFHAGYHENSVATRIRQYGIAQGGGELLDAITASFRRGYKEAKDEQNEQNIQALIGELADLRECHQNLLDSDNAQVQALIAEIDGLERIDFDEGGCDYPCSDGDNYRFDDVRAVLNKYRGVK